MIIRNVNRIDTEQNISLAIKDGKIQQLYPFLTEMETALNIDLTGALIFPGLINSHDHLDFNLFPQLGSKIYSNYTEWGKDIHQTYTQNIASILNIPIHLREKWGIYKNLLCGVTTVVNHGQKIKIKQPYINVLEQNLILHSVYFEKKWKLKLNNPINYFRKAVIHVGEGTDQIAKTEIDLLIKWNILKRKLVGIHGVALTQNQAKAFEAIVWCPQSNYFLLNKTANIEQLKTQVPILFGTDSTLTSDWNIWDHIRLANNTKMLNHHELYQTLTASAAKSWRLNCGKLEVGKDADLVVVKSNSLRGYEAFFTLEPSDILLVLNKGIILLFDETLKAQLKTVDFEKYSNINIKNTSKYVIGDLPKLMAEIKQYAPAIDFPICTKI